MDGFGSDGPGRSTGGEDDFLSGILGPDVGSKVSTGVWSAVGLVGSLANKAKTIAEHKVQQAQQEGWLDKTLDAARQGVSSAVEAGKATYSYVNENGGQAALGKTAEVLGSTAKRSISLVGSGADWLTEQISTQGQDTNTPGRLQAFSSGRMEGFGSDCPPRSAPSAAERAAGEAAPSSSSRPSYHSDPGPEVPPRKPSTSAGEGADDVVLASGPRPSAARGAQPPPPAKAADVWNDGDWGDWS